MIIVIRTYLPLLWLQIIFLLLCILFEQPCVGFSPVESLHGQLELRGELPLILMLEHLINLGVCFKTIIWSYCLLMVLNEIYCKY